MKTPYYKHNYDLSRCPVEGLLVIALLHRFLSLFRNRYANNTPNIAQVLMVYIMHRFFHIFHYLYILRDLIKKVKKRLHMLMPIR
ncbi:MAG: hypothetical protein HQL06_14500 [Nitrospirae bacterium]|nr:hypothetical protein [Nitrospirota bacterium]